MQPNRTASIALLGLALLVSPRVGLAGTPSTPETLALPGLSAPVLVTTDALGVPHLEAATDEDVFRAQGYLHARDRFFQMDVNRRSASGRLAELTGSAGVTNDFSSRPLGLRQAAQRSANLLTPPEQAILEAYSDGVNAYLAANPLPAEYEQLEISSVPPWSPVDSLAWLANVFARLAFAPGPLDIQRTHRLERYVEVLGEAAGRALFFEDLVRLAPMEPAATVPDASGTTPFQEAAAPAVETRRLARKSAAAASALTHAKEFPLLARGLGGREVGLGSNSWGVAASKSASERPMVAFDPHLAYTAPTFYYEMHLVVRDDPVAGPMNVTGGSAPGVPGVWIGQTPNLAWGTTSLQADILDVFQDRLLRDDPRCPARFCIESAGEFHPVEERSESFRSNLVGDGVLDNFEEVLTVPVLTVPFRSFGPILDVEDRSVVDGGPATETAVLTLQYASLQGTRRLHWLVNTQRARDVFEFREGARFLNELNMIVADDSGNLAYFSGGEVPLRADLEAGSLVGSHPALIRDGSGPNNWIPDPERSQGQVIPFRVMPFDEMPQVVNPPAGFVVNANEDPSGAGLDNDSLNQFRSSNPEAIYYFGSYFLTTGLRNGRVTRLLREKIDADETISLDDMKRFQANTQQLDAELMTPFLLAAFENAQGPGAPPELASLASDSAIVAAMGRLAAWDFSTPTGIPEGYDASDVDGVRNPDVSPTEAAHSVAATLYNVWRAKLLKNQVNGSLAPLGVAAPLFGPQGMLTLMHHLLSRDPFTGVGASGVDFFPEPAALAAEDRRDVALLQALRDALDALASNAYAAAFDNSTNQDDYRWGRLHRVTIPHPLGEAASIPPAAGFTDLAPDLAGISRDGGYGTVNRGMRRVEADGSNQFQTRDGAVARFLMAPEHPSDGSESSALGFSSLAGGSSGDPTSPLYASQLGQWLTVDYHPLLMTPEAVAAAGERFESFDPLRFCLLEPMPGCTEAGKASLSVDERKPGKEKLTLKLQKLAAETTAGDLGDPVAGATSYEICLYDEADTRIARLRVDRAGQTCGSKGKPCWKARGAGLEYKDGDAAADGVKKLAAKSGAAGKGKVQAQAGNKAKKGQEALPVGIAAALDGAASARVQVLVSDAACFEATLADVKKADGARFKAKTQ